MSGSSGSASTISQVPAPVVLNHLTSGTRSRSRLLPLAMSCSRSSGVTSSMGSSLAIGGMRCGTELSRAPPARPRPRTASVRSGDAVGLGWNGGGTIQGPGRTSATAKAGRPSPRSWLCRAGARRCRRCGPSGRVSSADCGRPRQSRCGRARRRTTAGTSTGGGWTPRSDPTGSPEGGRARRSGPQRRGPDSARNFITSMTAAPMSARDTLRSLADARS